MKPTWRSYVMASPLWLALCIVNAQLSTAPAQGTAFTYQGQLQNNGSAANGTYDFVFALYPTNTDGIIVAGPITNLAAGVTNGLFTMTLDFGSDPWNGQTNWLQIWVQTNGADSFTALTSRQEILPAPYALYAQTAASLGGNVALGQGQGNSVAPGDLFSFIGGGLNNALQAAVNYAVISGGKNNTIQSGDPESFIGGGSSNLIQGGSQEAVIVGGLNNTVQAGSPWSFIGGGAGNAVFAGTFFRSGYSFIGGGFSNHIAWGASSVIGGGEGNDIGFPNGSDEADDALIGGGRGNRIEGPGFADTIAGGSGNSIDSTGGPGDAGSTVAGGQENAIFYSDDSSIAGGQANVISSFNSSAIGGGASNAIGSFPLSGGDATIGGGEDNLVEQSLGTIGGGMANRVVASSFLQNAIAGTVGGGATNVVKGDYGTIPGGLSNVATNYAFAAGYNARAVNNGAFVWSDGTGTATTSFTSNQIVARASGGLIFLSGTEASPTNYCGRFAGVALRPGQTAWSTMSDRDEKKNFRPVDAECVLDRLAELPIERWNYKWEKDSDAPHIGPTGQDFKHAFYPGRDDTSITTLEFDGVELAAIKGLNVKLNRQLQDLSAQIKQRDTAIADLKQRLARLEAIVSHMPGQAGP